MEMLLERLFTWMLSSVCLTNSMVNVTTPSVRKYSSEKCIKMDVSRTKIRLDTSILPTSISGRREYNLVVTLSFTYSKVIIFCFCFTWLFVGKKCLNLLCYISLLNSHEICNWVVSVVVVYICFFLKSRFFMQPLVDTTTDVEWRNVF